MILCVKLCPLINCEKQWVNILAVKGLKRNEKQNIKKKKICIFYTCGIFAPFAVLERLTRFFNSRAGLTRSVCV